MAESTKWFSVKDLADLRETPNKGKIETVNRTIQRTAETNIVTRSHRVILGPGSVQRYCTSVGSTWYS